MDCIWFSFFSYYYVYANCVTLLTCCTRRQSAIYFFLFHILYSLYLAYIFLAHEAFVNMKPIMRNAKSIKYAMTRNKWIKMVGILHFNNMYNWIADGIGNIYEILNLRITIFIFLFSFFQFDQLLLAFRDVYPQQQLQQRKKTNKNNFYHMNRIQSFERERFSENRKRKIIIFNLFFCYIFIHRKLKEIAFSDIWLLSILKTISFRSISYPFFSYTKMFVSVLDHIYLFMHKYSMLMSNIFYSFFFFFWFVLASWIQVTLNVAKKMNILLSINQTIIFTTRLFIV